MRRDEDASEARHYDLLLLSSKAMRKCHLEVAKQPTLLTDAAYAAPSTCRDLLQTRQGLCRARRVKASKVMGRRGYQAGDLGQVQARGGLRFLLCLTFICRGPRDPFALSHAPPSFAAMQDGRLLPRLLVSSPLPLLQASFADRHPACGAPSFILPSLTTILCPELEPPLRASLAAPQNCL